MSHNFLDNNFFRFAPLLSLPAIQKDQIEIDFAAINFRIGLAAVPAVLAFGATIIFASYKNHYSSAFSG